MEIVRDATKIVDDLVCVPSRKQNVQAWSKPAQLACQLKPVHVPWHDNVGKQQIEVDTPPAQSACTARSPPAGSAPRIARWGWSRDSA
jgi:hypothetical protein